MYVGKESNNVDDVELGLVHDWDDVQTVIAEASISLRSLRVRMQAVKVADLAKQTKRGVRQLESVFETDTPEQIMRWRARIGYGIAGAG